MWISRRCSLWVKDPPSFGIVSSNVICFHLQGNICDIVLQDRVINPVLQTGICIYYVKLLRITWNEWANLSQHLNDGKFDATILNGISIDWKNTYTCTRRLMMWFAFWNSRNHPPESCTKVFDAVRCQLRCFPYSLSATDNLYVGLSTFLLSWRLLLSRELG